MEVNFLNQNPDIPSSPGVFQFDMFFSVFLSSPMCISALGPSSSPSSSLVISFIHSAFSLCFFGCYIFVQNCSVCLTSGCLTSGMFLCHALPIIDRIFFRCFWMSCSVCIVLPFVDISLVSLLLPKPFWFISSSCTDIFCLALSFPFSSHIFQDLSVLPFLLVLSGFPVEIPILVLTVFSCFLRASQFSLTLISPLHRLDHLTQLYDLLICKVVFDLFWLFQF